MKEGMRDPLHPKVVKTNDGIALCAKSYGDARQPAVLLLQPIALPARLWESLAQKLSERFYVIVFDPRGVHRIGDFNLRECSVETHATDAVAVADAYSLDHVTIIAWCTGALVAIFASHMLGARVQHVVLVAPGGIKMAGVQSTEHAAVSFHLSAVIWRQEGAARAIAQFQAQQATAAALDDAQRFFSAVLSEADAADPDYLRRRYLLMYQVLHDAKLLDRAPAPAFSCDVLIADQDEVVGKNTTQRIATRLRARTVKVVNGSHPSICVPGPMQSALLLLLDQRLRESSAQRMNNQRDAMDSPRWADRRKEMRDE